MVELLYFNFAFWLYKAFLALTISYINADFTRKVELESTAKKNAVSILKFEQKVPLAFELLIQQFISIQCMPWVMITLGYIYLVQALIIFGFLAYGFTFVLSD